MPAQQQIDQLRRATLEYQGIGAELTVTGEADHHVGDRLGMPARGVDLAQDLPDGSLIARRDEDEIGGGIGEFINGLAVRGAAITGCPCGGRGVIDGPFTEKCDPVKSM